MRQTLSSVNLCEANRRAQRPGPSSSNMPSECIRLRAPFSDSLVYLRARQGACSLATMGASAGNLSDIDFPCVVSQLTRALSRSLSLLLSNISPARAHLYLKRLRRLRYRGTGVRPAFIKSRWRLPIHEIPVTQSSSRAKRSWHLCHTCDKLLCHKATNAVRFDS